MTANASPAVLAPVDVDKVLAALEVMQDAAAQADSSHGSPRNARAQWTRYDEAENIVRAAVERMAADLAAAREENALLRNAAEREKLNLMAEASALRQRAEADAARLAWLQENEFDLVTRREDMDEDEYFIFWWVVDSRKSTARRLHSVSGHPLGSPREAIDAAILQTGTPPA